MFDKELEHISKPIGRGANFKCLRDHLLAEETAQHLRLACYFI